MRRTVRVAVGLAMVAALASWTMAVRAQEPPKAGPEQKPLEAEAGVWDGTLKFFPPGSETGEEAGKGVETNKMLAGGLWLISKFEADFGGSAFEGNGQYGYDPKKGKYVGSWVDSMSNRLSVIEGTYDEATKTLTMLGDGVDPQSGKPTKEKMTTEMKDKDTRIFTLYTKAEGANDFVKTMVITYKRRAEKEKEEKKD